MSTEQLPIALSAEPGIETSVAPPPVEVAADFEEPKLEPHDIAKTTVVQPMADDVNPQPTVTHAEAGNAHINAEPATTVDGVQADKPVEENALGEGETADAAKHDKKAATKEKVEKSKGEPRSFLSKLFGSWDKSPKKDKKVKTPKTEKGEAVQKTASEVETAAPIAEASEAPNHEDVVPVIHAPVVEPAPVESTEPPVVAEVTEVTPAPVAPDVPATETTENVHAKEEATSPKVLKASRRISTRISHAWKQLGKKEHGASPKDETPAEAAPATAEETPAAPIFPVEPPRLEEPIHAESLKIESAAPSTLPPAPVVSAAA